MIDDQLIAFRKAYPSKNVMQYPDQQMLVYKTDRGWGKRSAEDARKLIRENKWDLEAGATEFFSDNSFWVQKRQIS